MSAVATVKIKQMFELPKTDMCVPFIGYLSQARLFNSRLISVLAYIVLVCAGLYFQQDVLAADRTEVLGDELQVLIPAIAFGETYYLHDVTGRGEFYESFFSTVLITHGLKNTVTEQRPNGSSKSFPSGHTSAAFQGAAFIHARYGLAEAIPAYLAATFVGYSRIESHNHYPKDVFAGAVVGIASSFYFIEPIKGFFFTPLASTHDIGLNVAMRW